MNKQKKSSIPSNRIGHPGDWYTHFEEIRYPNVVLSFNPKFENEGISIIQNKIKSFKPEDFIETPDMDGLDYIIKWKKFIHESIPYRYSIQLIQNPIPATHIYHVLEVYRA